MNREFLERNMNDEQDKLLDDILTEALKPEVIPDEQLNQSIKNKIAGVDG